MESESEQLTEYSLFTSFQRQFLSFSNQSFMELVMIQELFILHIYYFSFFHASKCNYIIKWNQQKVEKKLKPENENLMNLNYVPYNPSHGPIGRSHGKSILNVSFRKQPMFIIN